MAVTWSSICVGDRIISQLRSTCLSLLHISHHIEKLPLVRTLLVLPDDVSLRHLMKILTRSMVYNLSQGTFSCGRFISRNRDVHSSIVRNVLCGYSKSTDMAS